MTVTPGVSESARSLPLGGVCQRVKLDVALTPGVCVVNVSDGSRGWELLLLLSDNSAAFCRHSHAVVLWNEARKRRAKSDRQCNRHICKKHIHRLHTHKLNMAVISSADFRMLWSDGDTLLPRRMLERRFHYTEGLTRQRPVHTHFLSSHIS